MKKSALIAILIIILVYVNWLSDGFAQTDPEQLEAYQKLLEMKKQQDIEPPNHYQSPRIFDGDEKMVNDSLLEVHRRLSSDTGRTKPSDSPKEGTTVKAKKDSAPDAPPRFGQNLFQNPQIGEINSAVIPEEYLLGPGDNIIINLWGRVQQEWNLTVDRQGQVFIPKVGAISAWGLTLPDFEERLDRALSKVYTGYERRVTLGKIRTIKVFVYGEVKAPGGYAVSALSTLFSALYMAGGPTESGSFRRIKLIRDQETYPVDLYDFLIAGDKSCDMSLLSGDVIFVPLVGDQATVSGEVKRPGIYELLDEEKISDVIELAGGPTAEAYLGRIMLDRIGDDDSRKVVDLDFSVEDKEDPPASDGDQLTVFSIYEMRENVVRIQGMVKHSGTFERTEDMRVSDLIEKADLLPKNVYRERADLYRRDRNGELEIIAINLDSMSAAENRHNPVLTDLDSLYIYNVDEVEPDRYVYIEGMVQRPGKYPLYKNLTASDLVFLAGNLKSNAYMLEAELARIDSQGNTDLIKLPLDDTKAIADMRLRENDRLYIRRIPGYQLHRMVTIDGEVKFPGRYSLTHKEESLWQLINRAGGFTQKAFPQGTVFRRGAIADDLKRMEIKHILEGSQPLVADSTGILRPVRTLNFESNRMDRIIIDMNQLIATNGRESDFKLQAGDYIFVPEIPTGISVMGEVCANGTIKYQPEENVKYYLEQAGGVTKRADKGQIRLVKANGRVYASGGVMGKDVDLGDIIIVPTEIKKDKDWFKFISTSLSILTGVATSILIIDRL